jgi:hypothetical protein
MTEPLSPHMMDQFDAASRDATKRLHATASSFRATGGTAWMHKREASASGDTTPMVTRFLEWIKSDEYVACRHMESPQPAYLNMGFPRLVVLCRACYDYAMGLWLGSLVGSPTEYECDGCKRSNAQLAAYLFQAGPMLVTSTLCIDCLAHECVGSEPID